MGQRGKHGPLMDRGEQRDLHVPEAERPNRSGLQRKAAAFRIKICTQKLGGAGQTQYISSEGRIKMVPMQVGKQKSVQIEEKASSLRRLGAQRLQHGRAALCLALVQTVNQKPGAGALYVQSGIHRMKNPCFYHNYM